MMRKALLFVIFRQLTIATVIRPRKSAVDNFNHLKSRVITEMMLKELSLHRHRLDIAKTNLSELYFQFSGMGTTAHIQNASMTSSASATVRNIATDIFDSRIDLSLTFPAVTVKGNVTFQQDPVWSSRHEEKYPFGFTLRNVTVSGLCFTRWTQVRYNIIDCDLRDEKFSIGHRKFLVGRVPIEKKIFFDAVIERMRTEIRTIINEKVVENVNALLLDVDVMQILRNPTVFQKYQDYVVESTKSANEFVDGIMEAVRKIVLDRYHDSFAIPNIEEGFRRKGILVVWRGSFKADHGTVRGLSTVSRVGDTVFATDNRSLTHFFGNLSFERLDLHYARYKAEFMNLASTGTLNTRLRPIRLHIHPYVNFETGKIYLEEFEIVDVGELAIDVTGLGTILSWIISKIATWVVGLARGRIVSDLQKKYDEYIRSVLSGRTIEEITGGKFFTSG